MEVPEVSLGVSWESESWEAEKSEVRTRVSSSVTRSGRATMLRGGAFSVYYRPTGSNPVTNSHTSMSSFPENGIIGNFAKF